MGSLRGQNFKIISFLSLFIIEFLSFWISRLFDLNKLRVLKNAKIFWKWPQIVKKFPNVNWRYESQGKVAFKSNVLSSEECDDCPWPSPPGTFHILIGKFSYFVIRFSNQISFDITFQKSDNEIGNFWNRKKRAYRRTGPIPMLHE